jgi:hypothetical protein
VVFKTLWSAVEPIQKAFYDIAMNIAPKIADMMRPAVKIAADFFNKIAVAISSSDKSATRVAEVMQGLEKLFTGMTKMVYTVIGAIGKVLMPILSKLFDKLMPIFSSLIEGLTEGFEYINKNVVPIIENALNEIMPGLLEVIDAVIIGLKGAWKAFSTYMGPLLKDYVKYLGDGTDGKPGIISGIKHFLKGLGTLVSALLPIMGKLEGWIMGVLLHPVVLEGLKSILFFLGDITMWLGGLTPELEAFGRDVGYMAEVIQRKFEKLFDWILDKSVWLGDQFKWIYDHTIGLFTGSADEAEKVANAIGYAATKSELAKVTLADLMAPPMQHGGIVTKPTIALIGEAGPEMVIPLKRDNISRIDENKVNTALSGIRFPEVIGTKREDDICKRLEGIERVAIAMLDKLTTMGINNTKTRPNIAFTLKGFAR